MGQLAIAHVDPRRSDPTLVRLIPRSTLNNQEEEAKNPSHKRIARGHKARLLDVSGNVEEDADGLTYWAKQDMLPEEGTIGDPGWRGIRKDVGIFTNEEFEFLMTKCLRSLSVYPSCTQLTHRRASRRAYRIFQRYVHHHGGQSREQKDTRREETHRQSAKSRRDHHLLYVRGLPGRSTSLE